MRRGGVPLVLLFVAMGCGRLGFQRVDGGGQPADGGMDAATRTDAGADAGAPPTITSLDPEVGLSVARAPGAIFKVQGTGFRPGAKVFVGGRECSATTFVDATHLACEGAPGLPIGVHPVEVENPDGLRATAPGSYTSLGEPVVWLRADTIAVGDGDPVDAWLDGSAAANDAMAVSPATRPILRAGIIGGRAAVRFDGTTYLSIPDDATLRPTSITIAAVASVASWTTWAKVVSRTWVSDGSHPPPFQSYSLGMSRATTRRPYLDLTVSATLSTAEHGASPGPNTPVLLVGVYDGTTATIFQNGDGSGPLNATDVGGPLDYNGMTVEVGIGIRSRYSPLEGLDGYIGEILIYGYALDATERTVVDEALIDRYGID